MTRKKSEKRPLLSHEEGKLRDSTIEQNQGGTFRRQGSMVIVQNGPASLRIDLIKRWLAL